MLSFKHTEILTVSALVTCNLTVILMFDLYVCTVSNEFKKRLLFSLQIVPLGTLINELVICDNNVI